MGVAVAVGVGTGVAVAAGVAVGVDVGAAVAVAVAVGIGELVAVGVGSGVGVAVGSLPQAAKVSTNANVARITVNFTILRLLKVQRPAITPCRLNGNWASIVNVATVIL